MTMPLTVDDVQQILETAIVAAKLAPPEVAPGLASTLAQATTSALNEIVTPATGPVLTTSIPVSVMSVTEALGIRNMVADAIGPQEDQMSATDRQVRQIRGFRDTDAAEAAEVLLNLGFIDVPKLLARMRDMKTIRETPKSAPVPVQPSQGTGSTPRVVSQVTGSVPAS